MAEPELRSPLAVRAAALAISGGVGALLIRALLVLPKDEAGLAPLVKANLDASGVKNPVTAVLLNFRGYDTMLEIAVLVLATIGVLSLTIAHSDKWPTVAEHAAPALSALARFLAPAMVLVSGYLLWAGEHAPGGAFQAGSVLGAAGILLALSGYARPAGMTGFALRAAITVGFIVFLAAAIGDMLIEGALLEYPADHAKTIMLAIEAWLTVSIAVILASLFISSASPVEELRRRIRGGR